MKTATVGEIQKNFSKLLRTIRSGEEVMVTRHGKTIAKISAIGPQPDITWPEFVKEAIEVKGQPPSQIIQNEREERA